MTDQFDFAPTENPTIASWLVEQPWPSRFEPVTLERGITSSMDMWSWREATASDLDADPKILGYQDGSDLF